VSVLHSDPSDLLLKWVRVYILNKRKFNVARFPKHERLHPCKSFARHLVCMGTVHCTGSICHSTRHSLVLFVNSVRTTRCMSSATKQTLEKRYFCLVLLCVISHRTRVVVKFKQTDFPRGRSAGGLGHVTWPLPIHPNSSSAFLPTTTFMWCELGLRSTTSEKLYWCIHASATHASFLHEWTLLGRFPAGVF
jgi:hypothetical protein